MGLRPATPREYAREISTLLGSRRFPALSMSVDATNPSLALQPDACGRVLDEERALSNVAPNHRGAAVAGRVQDRPRSYRRQDSEIQVSQSSVRTRCTSHVE